MGWRSVCEMMLGLVLATNVVAESSGVDVQTLAARQQANEPPALILDTRTPEEFAAGRVPGATLVPHDAIDAALAELTPYRDREIVLYCRSGRRSQLAEDALRQHGFTHLTQLEGSWLAWEAAGLPVETGTAATEAER